MPEDLEKKPVGFFQRLVDKCKAAKQRSVNKKALKKEFLSAVSDGVLTDDEIKHLITKENEFGLNGKDVAAFRIEVFKAAWLAAKRRGTLSGEQSAHLWKIQGFLQIADEEIRDIKAEITRSRSLHEIQQGNIHPIAVRNLVLQPDEIGYWMEDGTLYEERVVRRHYEGGSSGVSFRVLKGVSFRVGAHRGQLVSETGNVPISSGQMIITNRRIAFTGDRKSFSTEFRKIIDVQPALDGIRFSEKSRQKPRTILYEQKNGDFVCEVLSHFFTQQGLR